MKSIKLRAVAAGILATGAFAFFTPQLSVAADLSQPGKGWDLFQSRGGEQVPGSADYIGTAMNSAPGQDWDVFHSSAEGAVPITSRQGSTDMNLTFGEGWDVFHSGNGDRI
ncbi:MAG TPA: hypothetical protein VEP67_06485 [Thiobacillaceae bacterium]|nr:hypothetical protein [Thiobacillaceae bacterium]